MPEPRQPRPIYFDDIEQPGSKELAKRFQEQESVHQEDIDDIAQLYVDEMRRQASGKDLSQFVYVIEGLLDNVILSRVQLDPSPEVTEALRQIRSAVAEKIIQLVNEDPQLCTPEQVYILTDILHHSDYAGVDNVWRARHTNGSRVVKHEVTGHLSEQQKVAYQKLRESLNREPNTYLRPLLLELSPGANVAIGQELKFHTLLERVADVNTFNLLAGLRAIHDITKGLQYLQQHGLMVEDLRPRNIAIDDETGTAFLFDFGMMEVVENPTDNAQVVFERATRDIITLLMDISKAHKIKPEANNDALASLDEFIFDVRFTKDIDLSILEHRLELLIRLIIDKSS